MKKSIIEKCVFTSEWKAPNGSIIYKYNLRNKKSANAFEGFIKNALTNESCILNAKPTGDTKEVAYGK